MISIQNYRKMNIRQNAGIQSPASVTTSDPIMDSFMEKFSQFLSSEKSKSQLIGNSNQSSNSIFPENFVQTANEFYNQRSMNRSLSSSQTSKSADCFFSSWIFFKTFFS